MRTAERFDGKSEKIAQRFSSSSKEQTAASLSLSLSLALEIRRGSALLLARCRAFNRTECDILPGELIDR